MHTFHDWIKPGEIRYCSRCGWHLIPTTETLCNSCLPPLKEVQEDGTGIFRPRPSAKPIHDRLLADAEGLAAERQRSGIAPRFWMREPVRA